MRQIKLTAAFFVNPLLPDIVDIAYAHRLSDAMQGLPVKDIADALKSGKMRLAVPVDESSGYLTPIRAPCQMQADPLRSSEATECVDWLNALRKERPEAMHGFHVFVEEELSVIGKGRVVTWDPDEVVEGQCNLPLSSESVQLR